IPGTIDTTAIRKVTPISTPISEKKLLSFWVRRVSSASPMASLICMSGRRQPGVRRVAGDPAVAQHHDSGGMGGDVGLVGDHDDGLAPAVQMVEDPQNLLAGGAVQIDGGLVGQHNRGLVTHV